MSKGDKRRPALVDFKTYADNWDAVFTKQDLRACTHAMRGMFTDTFMGATQWRCCKCGVSLPIEE